MLVTPGMVELGEREESENRALGEAAAKVCDDVILVGPKRTKPIREGLLAAGFPKERIAVVRGIDEVPARLQRRWSARATSSSSRTTCQTTTASSRSDGTVARVSRVTVGGEA